MSEMPLSIKEPVPPCPDYQRYSHEAFPPYRFIPGLNPHPVRDPQGHSYGHEHQKLDFMNPKDWPQNESYLYGVDLYNQCFWWEAHEAWEDVWHTTDKDSFYGQYLQGLIQIAAAFIKWHLKQHDGLSRLFEIGFGRLSFVQEKHPEFMGLNLQAHLCKLQSHFDAVVADVNCWPDWSQNYPLIELKIELLPKS